MPIIELNNNNFKQKVLDKEGRIIVDFKANWCAPCQMLYTILEDLSDDFNIASVDIDEVPELGEQFKVSSIPCLILFENGKEIKRNVGIQSKKFLEKWLSK